MDRRTFLSLPLLISPLTAIGRTPQKKGKKMRRNFIWSGQSNMCDRGVTSQLPTFANRSRMFVYRRTWPWVSGVPGTWEPAVDVIDEYGASAGACGAVALGFLNRICDLFPNDEAAVVPYSIPGTAISAWAKWNRASGQYGGMIQRALWAEDQGVTAGFCFWQGEANTSTVAAADAWGAPFSELVSNVRVDMGNLDLPATFVRLGNTGNTATGWNQLRMRQSEIAMRKLVMTNIDGIAANADKTHYSTAGYIEIGERMADAIAPML
jgi:hypothetical protein